MDASATGPCATPDPQALAAVTAQAARFQAEGGQPGIAFGVVAGGRLVRSGGFGERRRHGGAPPDAHTGFRIASMTKSFTASALLLLRDEGALRLDDSVAEYVSAAAQLRGPTRDCPPITIRHLLTMAAGLPTDDPWGDRQQGLPAQAFTELVRGGLSFAWAPGTAFEYSNLGYALLGLVIESCTGRSYRDVVTQRLLDPLGMTSTGFDESAVPASRRATGYRRADAGWRPVPNDPYGAFAPMGGLFSTVADLARWVAGFTDAFPPRDDPEGDHPLCRASRRELQQAHRGLPAQLLWPSVDAAPTVRATGYGFGLLVEHDPVHGLIVGHSGGYPGFGSHMRWHPGTGLGVVLLGNATYTPAFRPAARMLALLLAGAAHPPRRSRRVPSGRAGTASLTGVAPLGASSGQAQPAPAGEQSWTATRQARAAIERLLQSWDDALAADVFADNVDLDRPLAERRAELEQIRDRFGPLQPHPGSPIEQPTPAQCSWWMQGPGGRVRLDILLTPQRPPRVQTLILTPAPQPSARLLEVAELVVAELARPCPQWPPDVATSRGVDPTALTRLLQVAAGWAGTCDIVAVTGGDGHDVAIFRLAGERGELGLSLTVELDPPPPDRSPRPVRRLALAADV